MFFSCSKSLIPAGVRALASRSQWGPTLQAALATPGLGQARRDASESSLATSFSFAFDSVHAGFHCWPIATFPSRRVKAVLSAQRSWETWAWPETPGAPPGDWP